MKLKLLPILFACTLTLTGCKAFMKMVNDIASSQSATREGVTYEEFHAAVEPLQNHDFTNYSGFICSGEWKEHNLVLEPTTVYFSDAERIEQGICTGEEELSLEMFKTLAMINYAWTVYPAAPDDIFYIHDYGYTWKSNVNYANRTIEFNADGMVVDYKEGGDTIHVHFVWLGGPSYPGDEEYYRA